MLRNTLNTLCLCAPLLFSACASGQEVPSNAASNAAPGANQTARTPTPIPQAQVVTASVEEVQLGAGGGSAETAVRLDIAEGYHVNANPPSDKFYIGTEIQAEPQEGITPGKPVYPPALTKKFSFAEQPLAVYEGRAVIKLPLRAELSAAKGRHTFKARIRVQPCNDQACLQPRTIEAAIPVVVN
ncbi:MAG: protein-disulfide reductase DsbD N-terminal domain-containing protein [Acidobacteria bacterium]|nr:protein-disulfide reductase DsbD N-terminal domain-containing protein [Acidobacteriota bacterium]